MMKLSSIFKLPSSMHILLWLFLVWLAGWSTLPLSRRLFQNTLPDAGLAAGRVLLLVLWALVAFLLGHAEIPLRLGALLLFPFLIYGLYFLWCEREELRNTCKEKRRAIVLSEVLFFGAFVFFLLLRGFWPEANDGEKPMDMALISSLARAEYLPPANPFAAGERLDSYYYFGHLQTALLTNATFSSPRWTYNLMCATLPALAFSSLFSLCAAIIGRLRYGVLAALLVLCCGTLEPLRIIAPPIFGERLDQSSYFATSRVIPFTINEYPFFTFAFGDLHAHFFAMPIAVLVISLAWAVWRRSASTPCILMAGAALAALLMTNSWDFPLYLLLVTLCILRRETWKRSVVNALFLFAVAAALAFPYWSKLQSAGAKLHWVGEFNLPLLPWLLVWGLIVGSWGIVFFRKLRSREKDAEYFFLCRLAWCGVLALVFSEIVWSGFLPPPYHRQDTVFKFGLQAWYFLGVAAACGILRYDFHTRPALKVVYALLIPVTLYSSWLVVQGRSRNFQKFVGFDAWSYLAKPEQQAAQWLCDNARDGDTIFEAEKKDGGDYSEYSRYAHATGVPAVIGPQAHSFQWLGDWDQVFARKAATRTVYASDDQVLRSAIFRAHRVRWIVIGELERREYGERACARLERSLPVAAQFGESHHPRRVVICHNPLR